ncbi:hypothetical protein ACHAXN_007717 [Cyclotella atomus]
MQFLICLLSAYVALIDASVSSDEALEHTSSINYHNDTSQTRYPPQMDEYEAALNLLIDITPIVASNNSSWYFRASPANNICKADKSSCSSTDKCCQGGCSTSGKCTCQPNKQWCFNYGSTDSLCCSNLCGTNGRCKCIPQGNSCAVGGEYCCNGLVCDGDSLTCIEEPIQAQSEMPTSKPTKVSSNNEMPTTKQQPEGSSIRGCSDGEAKVSVEIQTDRFGGDISWYLADQNGDKLLNIAKGTYSQFSHDKVDICLQTGQFNFTISDQYGDGICCAYGTGFVKISINEKEVLYFKSFGKQVSETLNIGFYPSINMTKRHRQYLKEHNKRRQEWHELNNVSYVPLAWSPALAEESRVYAVKLLDACNTKGILHEPGVSFGENLAKNKGKRGWGQLYPVTKIVGRWVDWEVNRTYPSNGHLTQALWRASKYLGCGESVKSHKGGKCRVQVNHHLSLTQNIFFN